MVTQSGARRCRGAVRHPLFARLYQRVSTAAEAAGAAEHRVELLAGLSGRVLEVGAGNGLNFAHYPRTVEDVVAVEPEPYLRRHAAEASSSSDVPIRVVDGIAENLPVTDDAFDAVVASLVLCSVRDQHAALAEIRRVLRADGELRFYEHVEAESSRLARAQMVADRTVWPRVAGGCHTNRDTVGAIRAAGFVVEDVRRFSFKPCALAVLTAPHVIGRAVLSG